MVSVKRHILKSISYRIVGTLFTITLAYFSGVPVKWAAMLGVGEILLKPIIYFLHERIWYKHIRFGLNKKN